MPPPGDDHRLAETVARIFARPLDRTRPLWELYLIHGLPGGRVGAAHQGPPLRGRRRVGQRDPQRAARPEPGGARDPAAPDARPAAASASPSELEMLGRGAARDAAPAAARAALGPDRAAEPHRAAGRQRVPARAADLRRGRRACGAGSASSQRPGASSRRPPRGRRRRAFNGRDLRAPPLRVRLALARHASRRSRTRLGITVNDVVVALCAGAVRDWLLERDELPGRAAGGDGPGVGAHATSRWARSATGSR